MGIILGICDKIEDNNKNVISRTINIYLYINKILIRY